uniref:Guanylate cyclase n=1 Tax=Rhabditophanes sp. KR3021 TaxID=114890 RepID=A0AC35UBX1_9BILA
MNHHIRLKVMLIDNYNEEFSSESSDQDYFEMIAERGEKTEVNSVNALFTNKITSKMGACYNYKYEAKKTMKKISPDKKWVYVGASVSILAAIIIFSLICYLIILRRKKVREQKISDLRWSNDMVSENNEYEEHTNKKNTNWVIGKKHSNNEFNSANGISQIEGIEMSERRGKDQVVPHPQLLAQTDSNASTIKQSPSLSNLNQDVDLSSLLTINYNENIGAGNFSYVLKGTLDIGGKDGVNKPLWYDNNINQAFAKGDNDETINQGRKSKDNDGNLMYNGNDSKFVIDVAIKMSLTVGNVYQKHESKEFLEKELEILKAVCGHEHVVYFHGSCIKDNSLCLILEYCSGGDLLKYIQNPQHQSQLSEKQLLKFAYQIADGMYYLAHLGLIHRDLSARNILLKDSDNLIAKIGDFGLSRILEETENVEVQNEYMLRRNAKIPVKWTAIEALNDGVYTEKSDVWAFSVLLFELFSFGQTPYKDMCLLSILPYLNLGKRLHRPSHANDNIWELMEQCWLEDPVNRPSFEKIRANLTKQLEDATEIYGYCLLERKGKIIKVGHIGAINVMPKAEQILEMCRKELWRDGILDDEFDIELVQTKACSDSFEGVALAANMFHVQNVKAFIGPYCNAEMDAVSKMSSYWNVPIIGYMAASNIFSDKNIYKTLARVSIRTTNSLALAVAATIKHYNWRDVLIITNTGVTALERLVAFEENFHLADINIMRKITFDENANAKSLVDAGIMQDIKNYGRIVVCIFSNTRETSKEFMAAVKLANMDFSFVYIFPWLISEAKERAPWIEENGTLNTTIKRMFSSSIIVDDVNSFDEIMINPFKDKLLANHIDVAELDLNNVYGYIHLYDALKLYALIAKQLLNETKNDLTSANNGKLVWNKMRKFSFPGLVSTEGVSAGMVVLDDRAERAAQYGAFYANHEKEDVLKILDMDPVFKSQCDGLKTKTGCYDLKVTDVVTGFWPSRSLSSYSCLIDRNWTVKLTDYGIADYIDKWCKEGFIEEECIKEGENKAAAKQKTYVLYASPESLKQTESNNRRRVDQNWMKTTIARKQSQDVYSLGIIIYEILFRALPFPDSKNLDELCIESKSGNSVTRPTINDKSQIHPDLCALLYDCWNINPEVRPSIRRVKLNTEHYLKVKGSLVDQMMRVMEQYANNLEKLVQERTGMLEEANKRLVFASVRFVNNSF